jgi:prevent-host-death family protein
MRRVGIFEAKTHLSALIDAVEKGEEIGIPRHGAPLACLIAAAADVAAGDPKQRRQRLMESVNDLRKRRKEHKV